jgi:hypothetical protein
MIATVYENLIGGFRDKNRRLPYPGIVVAAVIAVTALVMTLDWWHPQSPDPTACELPPFHLPHADNGDPSTELPAQMMITQQVTPTIVTGFGCLSGTAVQQH